MKYIIGDLHANIEELKKLRNILNLQSSDTCIFVGDYLGKNPYTKEILSEIRSIQKLCKCVFLKGNHDYVWERYLLHGETHRKEFLLSHGDILTLEEFSNNPKSLLLEDQIEVITEFLSDYIALLAIMQDYCIAGDFLATHAGISEEKIERKELIFKEGDYFIRPQKLPLEKRYLGQYTVVAGHTFLDVKPTVNRGHINIDLGAGYGKYLGALSVEEALIIRSDGETFDIIYE